MATYHIEKYSPALKIKSSKHSITDLLSSEEDDPKHPSDNEHNDPTYFSPNKRKHNEGRQGLLDTMDDMLELSLKMM
jgi:hypothetical protein